MFYCWHKKNITPSSFKAMTLGEKAIIKAFAYKEIELQEKANREV